MSENSNPTGAHNGAFDVEVAYPLREDDLQWRKGIDNILARRLSTISKHDKCFRSDDKEYDEDSPLYASIRQEPHYRLFHGLCNHDNDRPDLRDCARAGSVWVHVVIREKYLLDTSSGKWIMPPVHSSCATGKGASK